MSTSSFSHWQQVLLTRLEGAMGRPLVATDMDCIAWNPVAESLTVEMQPLLRELRSRNLISNVFRTQNVRRLGK